MNKIIITTLLLITAIIAKDKLPTDNQIQGRLNIVNGASAECVMHNFYSKSNWVQIEGEIGRNGIDGLYYKKKNGVIREVLVAESKWNKSRLGKSGKNKLVKQMSKQWVTRTMKKLINKYHTSEHKQLLKLINSNQYRGRLFSLKPLRDNQLQITISKITNKGVNAFDIVEDRKLDPISVTAPKNSFEKNVLHSFNKCRVTYLNKYFSFLTSSDINMLLRDNYLQKKDIKAILSPLTSPLDE
jgi:hypothetical protein